MRPDLAPRRLAAAIGAAAALPPLIALRGFTVDDAWIPARYAAHLAAGLGYRFNPAGPATDGVTPLPWAPLLAILGGWGGISIAWWAGRVVGAVCWLIAAAALAHAVEGVGGSRWRCAALLPLPLSAPLGAWAVAGLETGLTTLLATLAVVARGPAACAAAGLAAALRPEMIVFASVIGLGSTGRPATRLALALGPWLSVVAARLFFFGSPVPLSVLAKPSDLAHGAAYALAGLLLAGAPALGLPLPRWSPPDRSSWAWPLAAALAHAAAVAWAGGDWMPLSRLLVPSLPAWILVGARLASCAPPSITAARALLAAAGMLFAWSRAGAAAAGVVEIRQALIDQGRPALRGLGPIAALDAGWLGAATPGPIVDLAGLTDPALASLPGGHTSKRVTGAMLDRRGVDALVLLRRAGCQGPCVRDDGGPFDRRVEEQLAHDRWVVENFSPRHEIFAGPLVYVVLARKQSPP